MLSVRIQMLVCSKEDLYITQNCIGIVDCTKLVKMLKPIRYWSSVCLSSGILSRKIYFPALGRPTSAFLSWLHVSSSLLKVCLRSTKEQMHQILVQRRELDKKCSCDEQAPDSDFIGIQPEH